MRSQTTRSRTDERPRRSTATTTGRLRGRVPAALLPALLLPAAATAQGQGHLEHPAPEFERLIERGRFAVESSQGVRYEDDPTLQAVLRFEGGERATVKMASAPRRGGAFNNRPRYEAAAYQVQKLFLDPEGYVVPPTTCRCLPPDQFEELFERRQPTFRGSPCGLVLLQAWLRGVIDEGVFDRDRFASDTAYARHLANANVLTYLIDHKDANKGNVVVAQRFLGSRVFAVDNGVSFESRKSNRGTAWRRLRVDRIPRETVERLRALERSDLEERLAVFAQFEGIERVEPTAPLDPDEGLRRDGRVLQIGLEEDEIEGVWERIRKLLERVDEGDLETF